MAQVHSNEINGVPVPYGATVEELRLKLKECGPIARAAFEALSHTPGKGDVQSLNDLSCSLDWRYRRCAVEAISDHLLTLVSAGILTHALKDQNVYVVFTACRAVGHHRISTPHTQIINLLAHAEPSVREVAVEALVAVWQPQDLDTVKRLYLFDCSPEVSKCSAYALNQNATSATWRPLYNLWQGSSVARNRLWAVQLMHRYGGQEKGQLLGCFQSDEDGHVRKAAAS